MRRWVGRTQVSATVVLFTVGLTLVMVLGWSSTVGIPAILTTTAAILGNVPAFVDRRMVAHRRHRTVGDDHNPGHEPRGEE